MIKLDQINIIVGDMEAMADFYRRLGVELPAGPPEWAPHHRNSEPGEGVDLDLDSQPFAAVWNRGWPGGPGILLGFRVPDRPSVDRLHDELTAAGYASQQEPYDAFWGSRFAVVADPDGNAVGLMSPRDDAFRRAINTATSRLTARAEPGWFADAPTSASHAHRARPRSVGSRATNCVGLWRRVDLVPRRRTEGVQMSTGWQVLPGDSEVLAVHAAMLHTGKVLYFSGDEHDRNQHMAGELDHTRLFDCATLQVEPAPSPTTDVFCAGHAMLGDGRLLVAGGTESFPHEMETMHEGFTGLRDTWIFKPGPDTWVHAADLSPEPGRNTGGGRWYPTLVTVPDGRVVAVGGIPMQVDSRMFNNAPEAFRPNPAPKGKWTLIGADDPTNELANYPRMHVLPDGRIFSATPTKSAGNRRLNAATAGWADVCAPPSDAFYRGSRFTSVLLPLLPSRNHRPRVLSVGGSQPLVVDLGASSSSWGPTAPRTLAGSPRRIHGNAVLLPTGDVFVCGGVKSTGDNSDSKAVLRAELYRPTTNRWFRLEPATVVRNYHSVALLMPDGRVWTAGSNHNGAQSFPEPSVDNRELRIELYEPSYVAQSRPEIVDVPTTVTCGEQFTLETPQANSIGRVALIRTGSVTHGFNPDQRYVACRFERSGPSQLEVSAPPTSAIAPPGFYLLFVVTRNRIPSEGRFVQVKRA